MAFGLFKKKEAADLILINGTIRTLLVDDPEVQSLAVRDGKILAMGDQEEILADFEDDQTELIDLEGGVVLPGFILMRENLVMDCFQDLCYFIDESWDLETLKESLKQELEKGDYIFGYGYHPRVVSDLGPEEMRAVLDEVSSEKPLVLLSSGGFQVWLNSFALEQVKAVAEEEGVAQITLPYIVGVLELLDFERLQEKILEQAKHYCQEGVSSLFDLGTPDYFQSLYQEALVGFYQEGFLKQRFYGSLLINREVDPNGLAQKLMQNRTLCAELEGFINFNLLHLLVKEDKEPGLGLSKEGLHEVVLAASERDFDLYVETLGPESLRQTLEVFDEVRGSGYRKNLLMLATEETITDEMRDEFISLDDIHVQAKEKAGFDKKKTMATYRDARSMEEYTDMMNIETASLLGEEDKLGALDLGHYGDFAIFDVDPFQGKANLVMTILGGQVVYDQEEDQTANWYKDYQKIHLGEEELGDFEKMEDYEVEE